ncbi:MAG: DUF1508 domain-containing protein [Clostridia bacterium]|nr:DUF1508 domain-containing protein [Clostridia bacterium]
MINLLCFDFNQAVQLGSGSLKLWQLIVAAAIVALIIVVIIVCAAIAAKKKKKEDVQEETNDSKEEQTPNIVSSDNKVDDIVTENSRNNASEYASIAAPNIEQTAIVVEREENVDAPNFEEAEEESQEAEEETTEEPKEESNEEPIEDEVVVPIKEEEIAEDNKPEEPTKKPEPVEEKEEIIEEEPKEEVVEEVKEEPVEEVTEEAKEEPVVEVAEEKKPAEKKTAGKKAKPAVKPAEKKASTKPAKKEAEKEEKEVAKAENVKPRLIEDAKKKAEVKGKFEVCNAVIGGFNYLLRANNGQLLYESKTYKSKDSCIDALDRFIEAVDEGMFTIRADKFKNYKFILKSPTSNLVIYVGESFTSKDNCESNINSVKRFAPISPVYDITRDDFEAKFDIYEISKATKDVVEKGNGASGKWEISQVDESDKKSPFTYTLTANNGQLLYESRDYASKVTCKQGLETFIETIKDGYFIIDPDKAGRFKFILRSQNSSMEYEGQSYDTKQACEKNVDSVYRFALLTPVDKK